MQNAYASKSDDFPVTEMVAAEILSLPMFPQIQPEMQQHIASIIREFSS